MNKPTKLYKTTLAAMFAALIYVATAFLMMPLPGNGYAHLGDCFVVVGALLLGPVYGAAAAGIGSALSDLFLGYGFYAPATLVIKALMAVTAALVFKGIRKAASGRASLRLDFAAAAVAGILAELLMVFGYFVFEWIVYGIAVAAVDVVGNSVQGLVGLVTATLLYTTLNKTGIASKIS